MNADDRSFEIRVAKPEDAAALVELLEELGLPAAVGVVEQRLTQLADRGETVFVGTRGVEVLGFVTLHVTPVLHRPTPVGRGRQHGCVRAFPVAFAGRQLPLLDPVTRRGLRERPGPLLLDRRKNRRRAESGFYFETTPMPADRMLYRYVLGALQ